MKYSASDIEDIIYRYLPENDGYADSCIAAMNYAFKAGGKRLRPMMMRLCYDMFADDCGVNNGDNQNSETIERFMAAIEMIHTYSLIHDDLPALDNDDLRRGRPTVHKVYGEDVAILAGDGLLNYAFETASAAFAKRPGDVAVEKAFMQLAAKPGIYGMIGGQTLDVVKTGKTLDEAELDYIYHNKTSALIQCAMMTGALLGGADDESVELLGRAADCVGMAFQVQDDILDVEGNQDIIGKPVLSDEKNDKYTYVTIHGMGEARAYVGSKSDEANRLLDELIVRNAAAKDELKELISALVHRDR
jgi:geranylgeranyl diphosphate synthase type II